MMKNAVGVVVVAAAVAHLVGFFDRADDDAIAVVVGMILIVAAGLVLIELYVL